MRRDISKQTRYKILKLAIEIIQMNGSNAGNRCCQDWSGTDEFNPTNLFTEQELDDISFNYELENSNGDDYDKYYNGMHDEMVASFAIANELKQANQT